jgi:TusA-related sulfurtransferase
MVSEMQVSKTQDCRGELCPIPIIHISKAIKEVQVGEVLLLLATDPGAEPDMAAWTKNTGHELLQQTQEDSGYKFWVRRTN